MNTDIRIITSFKDHPKRIKLEMMLGKEATSYLIDLWLSTAVNKPDGILTEWDELDIAIAAGWRKDPLVFCKALIDCKFLKKKGKIYIIHDWDEHQGWACGAKKRSEHARVAAISRWDKRTKIKAKTILKQCDTDARAMPEHQLGNAPTPKPSPKPKPNPEPKQKTSTGTTPQSVKIFRENANRYPAKSWFKTIHETVGDIPEDLELWGKIVHAYVGQGWNPTNVSNMLEFYKMREIPKSGKQVTNTPTPRGM